MSILISFSFSEQVQRRDKREKTHLIKMLLHHTVFSSNTLCVSLWDIKEFEKNNKSRRGKTLRGCLCKTKEALAVTVHAVFPLIPLTSDLPSCFCSEGSK